MVKEIIPSPRTNDWDPVGQPGYQCLLIIFIIYQVRKDYSGAFQSLSIYRFNPATRPAIVKNAAALPPTTIAPLAGLVDALEAEPEPVVVPEPVVEPEPVVLPVPPG